MARRTHHPRLVRLVERAELGSSAEATKLIAAGRVMVNGIINRNPHSLVAAGAAVTIIRPRTLRGTVKLRAGLAAFGADVAGRTCLDVGAAAGGFTVALLEGGARRVYAVDTGYGQLQGRLRQDPRVVNLERTNLGDLGPTVVPEPVGMVCMDLSYLALAEALPQLGPVELEPSAQLVCLVKPTFELGSGSLITDEDFIEKAVTSAAAAAERAGWSILATTPAPVTGAAGAPEVFIYGRRGDRS